MWTKVTNYITALLLILVGVLTLCGGQPLGVLFGLMMFTAMFGSYALIPRFWQMFAETNVAISKWFMTLFPRDITNIVI